MKIGILTSSIAGNIGGIMQNYALQQVLKSMGHQPLTIDHYTPYSRMRWFAGRVKGMLTRHTSNVPYPWFGRIGSKKVLQFAFNHIDKTQPIKEITPRIIDAYQWDALIVGSDQVWRREYNDLETMFLGFAEQSDIKRVAYGASFGTEEWDYPEETTNRCRELASLFNAISVRERSDVILCQQNLGVDAVNVLDPTLLLDTSNYTALCENICPANTAPLFGYILDPSTIKLNYAKKLAHNLGAELKWMSAESNLRSTDTIEQWIANYRDARFVITDSYHGVLFSIMFNKDFVCINNPRRGQSRLNSILGILGLRERLLNVNELEPNIPAPIDWNPVNALLKKEVDNSLHFLTNSLAQ